MCLRRGDGVYGVFLKRDGRALRRVVQATARVCSTCCAARARPLMRSALYRPWCFSFGYELPWSDPRRAAFERLHCCGIGVLKDAAGCLFLLSLWLSRCQALRLDDARGQMIRSKAGPLSRARIASRGGPRARMKTATAACSARTQLAACKTLASPAWPKRTLASPR